MHSPLVIWPNYQWRGNVTPAIGILGLSYLWVANDSGERTSGGCDVAPVAGKLGLTYPWVANTSGAHKPITG